MKWPLEDAAAGALQALLTPIHGSVTLTNTHSMATAEPFTDAATLDTTSALSPPSSAKSANDAPAINHTIGTTNIVTETAVSEPTYEPSTANPPTSKTDSIYTAAETSISDTLSTSSLSNSATISSCESSTIGTLTTSTSSTLMPDTKDTTPSAHTSSHPTVTSTSTAAATGLPVRYTVPDKPSSNISSTTTSTMNPEVPEFTPHQVELDPAQPEFIPSASQATDTNTASSKPSE